MDASENRVLQQNMAKLKESYEEQANIKLGKMDKNRNMLGDKKKK
jgi:hypothetical protein